MLSESQISMLTKQKTTKFVENEHLNSFLTFWLYIIKKIIFTCTSLKVWSLIGFTWVNFYLVTNEYINGSNFAAIQVCLITTVLAAREYSKRSSNSIIEKIKDNPIIEKITDKLSDDDNTDEEISD